MNTEQSLPNGRLGVFPPVYEKSSDSRRFFEEAPYTYGRFDTTPKALIDAHTVDRNKKFMNPDLEYNTTSDNNKSISRTTDEMTLGNNALKLPLFSVLSEVKIDFLDKTTVKIDSETTFNEENNVTNAANVNTEENDKKTTTNPSSTNTSTASSKTVPVNNNIYLKENNDINPLRVPVSLKPFQPHKDVLSRAVKYYKDFTASTPSSYLDMNVIRAPLSYRMGDNLHVHFPENHKDQDNSAKLLKRTSSTYTSFGEYPYSSKSPKDTQYGKPSVPNGNLFSLANNPFMKNKDTKSMKEENTKESIVSNILNAMREILPTPVNFTIVNFSK